VQLITVTLNPSLDRTLEVPAFEVGGHLKGRVVRLQPAGKGVNVSRCLAALGVPSVVAGLVGRREVPLFHDSFADTRAEVALVPVDDSTRTNTTILDPERGTETHVREAGFQVRPEELAALRSRLAELAGPETLFAFCGSLPPGIEPHDLGGLIEVCRGWGGRVAADLNGSELGPAVRHGASLIKPNVEEMGELLGRDLSDVPEADLLTLATDLLYRVDTILLTRGADGALELDAKGGVGASVSVDSVRNTVGCGDALLAGYLAGLWRDEPAPDRLRLAVACGAAAALTDTAGDIDPGRVAELRARATTWVV
jgi:1-phosphofructokinase